MITVLSGANSSALSNHLKKMKLDFTNKHSSSAIEQINGESIQKHQLSALLQGVTLFSTDRLVVIKSISAQKEVASELALRIKDIPSDTHIVLVEPQLDKRTVFYKELVKSAQMLSFEEMNELRAADWVRQSVKKSGGSISQSDAVFLVQRTGTDQARLENELNKLLLLSSTVNRESITSVVEQDPRETVFELLEYALGGQLKRALYVLAQLKAMKSDPHQLLGMLIWQTNVMAIVHSAKNKSDSEIAKQTKINPYVVQKTRSLVRRLDRSSLTNMIDAVVSCDARFKESGVQPYQVLEFTVIKIAS